MYVRGAVVKGLLMEWMKQLVQGEEAVEEDRRGKKKSIKGVS